MTRRAPRFLFASLEPPGRGGSGTAGFDLFRRMLADGHEAHFVNLLERRDSLFYSFAFGVPWGLGEDRNVRRCRLGAQLPGPHPALEALVRDLAPDVVIGLGYRPTLAMAGARGTARVVLFSGTCKQAQDYITTGRARDAVSLAHRLDRRRRSPWIINQEERAAVHRADLVIANSALSLEMFHQFFPSYRGRIFPQVVSAAEWIAAGPLARRAHALPFAQRDIDVLFVASSWDRRIKNFPWVTAIARRLRGSRVHLVGESWDVPASITSHGFVASRDEMFALMGRARCVACPSRMDAAPGILFEAAALGCNVVASRNCGNWEICHPDLLVEPFRIDGFVECIRRAVARPYPDRLQAVLDRGAYAGFVATMTALARPFVPTPWEAA